MNSVNTLPLVRVPGTDVIIPIPKLSLATNTQGVLEPSEEEFDMMWPGTQLLKEFRTLFEEKMNYIEKSAYEAVEAIKNIGNSDIRVTAPITPHAKRSKRIRIKKRSIAAKRVTRSTMSTQSSISAYNNSKLEPVEEMEDVQGTSNEVIPMSLSEEEADAEKVDVNENPVEVRHLIEFHENLIDKNNATTHSEKKLATIEMSDVESHSSPLLRTKTSKNSDNMVQENHSKTENRSMEDMIYSCQRKNPIVSMKKLHVDAVDSPQGLISLRFDTSTDEDIADLGAPATSVKNHLHEAISETPLSTSGGSNSIIRRSLNIELHLSHAESELDNDEATHQADDEQRSCIEDSLDEQTNNSDIRDGPDTTSSQASSSVCSSTAATVVLDDEEFDNRNKSVSISEHEQKVLQPRRSTRRSGIMTGLAAKRKSMSEKMRLNAMDKKQTAEIKRLERTIEESTDSNAESEISIEEEVTNANAYAVADHEGADVELSEGEVMEQGTPNGKTDMIAVQVLPASPEQVEMKEKPMKRTRKIPSRLPKHTTARKRNLEAMTPSGMMSPSAPKSKLMKCASPFCYEPRNNYVSSGNIVTQPFTGSCGKSSQRSRATFLNRSTVASRCRRTPGMQSPSISKTFSRIPTSPFKVSHLGSPQISNISTSVNSFLKRNTPLKASYQEEVEAKRRQLEEKQRRGLEAKKKREVEKLRKIEENKRKRSARLRHAADLRERKEKEEKEKQIHMAEKWEKQVANAEKVKVLRKKDEVEKNKKLKKKMAEAEEIRQREQEEKVKKILDQEQEKEHRLQEKFIQREKAQKKLAEQQKQKEREKQEKIRLEREAEDNRRLQMEEKRIKEEEEMTRRRHQDEAARQRQLQLEQEEAERKKRDQEKDEEKRRQEHGRQEELRIQKEKEAEQRVEEEVRRKQREVAKKREKEEKRQAAKKKKIEEEMVKTELLRKKREEMRKEAEYRREEERLQREAEKLKMDEERRKLREAAEREKQRCMLDAKEKLLRLEEEHRKEKERFRAMNCTSFMNNTTLNTTGLSKQMNSTYTLDMTYGDNTSINSPQSYALTPQVQKSYLASTEENYNIDDLASGDSTDDDEAPRKIIPKWAKGGNLRRSLIEQYYNPPDLVIVFANALADIKLEDVFSSIPPKSRYFKRTSSAHWTSPIMPPGHLSFTEQCRGFDH